MPPREKDKKDFIQDVGVGNVEVVFERGDRDVAIELQSDYVNMFAIVLVNGNLRSVPCTLAQPPSPSCRLEIPSEPWDH